MNPVLQGGLLRSGSLRSPTLRNPPCKDLNILLFFQYFKDRFILFTQCHLAQI